MGDYSFYNYGIRDISINKENNTILNINYGHKGKKPIHIFKNDIFDFMKAIMSEQEMEELNITDKKVKDSLDMHSVEYINSILSGRAMVIVSGLGNARGYYNSSDNGIRYILGLNMDGRIKQKNLFDFEKRKPRYIDLQPIKQVVEDEEQEV